MAEPRAGHGGVGWMRIPAVVITRSDTDVTGLRHRRHLHVGVEAPDSSVRHHMHVGAETADSSVRRLPPTVRHILAP